MAIKIGIFLIFFYTPCAALQMSMSGEESSEATGAGNNLLGNQAFISSVLSSVSLHKP